MTPGRTCATSYIPHLITCELAFGLADSLYYGCVLYPAVLSALPVLPPVLALTFEFPKVNVHSVSIDVLV